MWCFISIILRSLVLNHSHWSLTSCDGIGSPSAHSIIEELIVLKPLWFPFNEATRETSHCQFNIQFVLTLAGSCLLTHFIIKQTLNKCSVIYLSYMSNSDGTRGSRWVPGDRKTILKSGAFFYAVIHINQLLCKHFFVYNLKSMGISRRGRWWSFYKFCGYTSLHFHLFAVSSQTFKHYTIWRIHQVFPMHWIYCSEIED